MKPGSKIAALLWNLLFTEGAVMAFIVTFHLSYLYLISPQYGYQGFVYAPGDPVVVPMSFVLALLPSLTLPLRLSKPSGFVLWLIYLMVYVPVQLILAYTSSSWSFVHLLPFQMGLLMSMLVASLVPRLPVLPLPRLFIPAWIFWLVVLSYVTLVFAALFKTFGFRGLAANLTEVYKVRLEAREALSGTGRWIGYALRWLSEAIDPFLMAVGLSERRWLFLVLGIVGQILIYSFDATKSTLGSIVLIVAVFYLLSRTFRAYARHFVLAFLSIFPLVAALDSLMGQPVYTGLLLRRLFAVPGLLTSFYFDYFSNHPYFYWAYTSYARVLGFVNTAYPEYASPGFLIGDVYFRNPAGNANANLWADGYANAGLWGVVLMTLLLMMLLWFYDSVSAKKDLRVALLLIAMPTYAITNTSLLTSLLSHGWLPAILLMWYYTPPRNEDKERR